MGAILVGFTLRVGMHWIRLVLALGNVGRVGMREQETLPS